MNKQFAKEFLASKYAQLDALIFKNDFLNIRETLFYSINIDLAEFTIEEQQIQTSISLNFIRINIYNLTELQNKIFQFPINPADGFIDGSIYLFDVHNPIDVYKIEFGKIETNTIEATIYFNIDFEYENTEFKNLKDVSLKMTIKFGELKIDTDIMNTNNFDEDLANKLVAQFGDLNNYEKPVLQDQQIIYKIKSLCLKNN